MFTAEEYNAGLSEAYSRGYHNAFVHLKEHPSSLKLLLEEIEDDRRKKQSRSTSLGNKSRYAQTNRRIN